MSTLGDDANDSLPPFLAAGMEVVNENPSDTTKTIGSDSSTPSPSKKEFRFFSIPQKKGQGKTNESNKEHPKSFGLFQRAQSPKTSLEAGANVNARAHVTSLSSQSGTVETSK